MQSSDILPGTTELGSLIANSNDDSQFVGSSSGVYFINTVRQAFAKSLGSLDNDPLSSPGFPAAEETLVGPESLSSGNNAGTASSAAAEHDIRSQKSNWSYDPEIASVLGESPDLENARQLMMMYFKVWHPIFPFLHGPSFLEEMEALYSVNNALERDSQTRVSQHQSTCWTAIFQCVFNLAALLQPEHKLRPGFEIQSVADFPKLVGILLYRHDMLSLQAVLVMQLYLVATMSLHNASLIGGSILRSILHAGLHRCPYRYKQLTSHDRHLRKRIFWCAYAIDRYLSQALGLPLGIQDSDLDVCLPGNLEYHAPADPGHFSVASPAQDGYYDESSAISRESAEAANGSNGGQEDRRLNRESTLASYVIYGKLTGRALELFHKSIQNRQIRRSAVLYLVSDVHKWWNNLPSSLQQQQQQQQQQKGDNHNDNHSNNPTSSESAEDDSFDLSPFFSVLYEHLILCINRPYLSLDPSSPDFCSSLQTCIGAARNILSSLKTQLYKGQALFWPGLLSAAYMSGLIIAFACQLKQYVLLKGCQEIRGCLEILQVMSKQWETAKHCHTALSFLLLNIQRINQHHQNAPPPPVLSSLSFEDRGVPSDMSRRSSNKRQKVTHAAAFDDQTSSSRSTTTQYNNDNLADSPQDQSQALEKNRVSGHKSIESHNKRPPFQSRNAAIAATTYDENLEPSPYSPLLMMTGGTTDNSRQAEESLLQWPGGPTTMTTTNFDLNMTDLFQGSTWDPSLFDAFTQGYLPSQDDL